MQFIAYFVALALYSTTAASAVVLDERLLTKTKTKTTTTTSTPTPTTSTPIPSATLWGQCGGATWPLASPRACEPP
ncbi:hypothetical protein D9619_007847 [Psilocybe cf. subviscida]|uniref:CBM1 domain-containing protein n=1 Tax=Psilocybe cf. subviscida TaxID=2480587 RepID=A0A8H5ATZ8_9AGAR|nr:hypothetical protein D9619_007847 [Psilocybe cf. subviscida]